MAYDNVVNALTGTKKVPANMKTFAEGPQAYANLDPSMAGLARDRFVNPGKYGQWNPTEAGDRTWSEQSFNIPTIDGNTLEANADGFVLGRGGRWFDHYTPEGAWKDRTLGDSAWVQFREGIVKPAAMSVGAFYGAQGMEGLMGASAPATAGGSTAAGAAELGANGAFLGEGVASGVPAWDAAAIKSAAASGQLGTAASYAGQTAAGGTGMETLGKLLAPSPASTASTVAQATQSGGPNPGNPSSTGWMRDAAPLVGAAATLASGKSPSSPQVPDYVKAAIATGNAGKYDEQTPYGTVTWSLRPGADPMNPQPGDYVRSTNFSPEQQRLYEQNTANQTTAGQVGGRQLAELGSGRQAVQDALYRRATQYYGQNFGDQENQLRARLAAQGLNEGSEAFERELRNFRQTRDSAYADATDRAIAGADQQENNAVARIVNILNMSKATTPTSGNSAGGAGTDLLSAANQAYTANLGASNAQAAANAQQQNAILQLVLGGMKYYGG